MKTTVMLMGGSRRVGKDTAARILVENLFKIPGTYALRVSFAEALREEVSKAYNSVPGLPKVDFWTEDPEVKEKIVRPLLITWGQARRAQDPDYWVNKVITLILRTESEAASGGTIRRLSVVVSDWRFPNELVKMKEAFPVTFPVHIERPGQFKTLDEGIHDGTIRELSRARIVNDRSPDDFQRSILSLMYSEILHFNGNDSNSIS